MTHLPPAHGGALVDLMAAPERAEALKAEATGLPSHTLTPRQLCDLEMLLSGAFSPLTGFLNEDAWSSVIERMRLPDGLLWPLPVCLDVPEALARKLAPGTTLALRDAEGFMPAVLHVESVYQPDRGREAEQVYGTTSETHPGVRTLLQQTHGWYVGGRVEGVQLPEHLDFETLRDTPSELRHYFQKHGWRRVVAFPTSKPMHRVHVEATLRAAREAGAHVLIHPVVGMAKPGDLDYFARVRCYEVVRRHYPAGMVAVSLLPAALRMAGPREALHNAIVRQNYGCSHLIVGPDSASPPASRHEGARFYPRYAAQELVAAHEKELGIRMVPIPELAYSSARGKFLPVAEFGRDGAKGETLAESELFRRLANGDEIPAWYSWPDVLAELSRVHPPRSRQGFTLFFTGLSGSGKSTLARILYAKFIEAAGRPVTLLDGDVVRQQLSSELGFSKEHRDLNIRRIGYVASEITKNGGIAICAPIAPYAATRLAVREMVERRGGFVEIHVATALEVCEGRDRKGLYAKARRGEIPAFTGISDPYEVPEHPEIRLDTGALSAAEAAGEVMLWLVREGYLEGG